MVRTFVADNNQVIFLWESGTYNTASGAGNWIGLVQEHTVSEDQGVIPVRYAGNSSRNVGQFVDGPTTFGGTFTYYPQEWQMLVFALGKNSDAGSPSPYTHTITEVDSENVDKHNGQILPSFQIEDGHQDWIGASGVNFIRTTKGCMVDSLTLTATEGEPVSVEVNYVAQSISYTSGAVTSVSADTSSPFMWSQFRAFIPSGTLISAVKEMNITLNNNLEVPNYVDNSRNIGVPIPTQRDYEVTLTVNAEPGSITKQIYDQYWVGGSTFNMLVFGIASTGSRQLSWVFSGCKLVGFEGGTPNEGVNEQSWTIQPQTSSVAVDSTTQYYNAGSYA